VRSASENSFLGAGTTDRHLHDVDADVDDHGAGLDPGAPDQLRPADGDDQDVAVAQDLRQVQGVVVRLRRALGRVNGPYTRSGLN